MAPADPTQPTLPASAFAEALTAIRARRADEAALAPPEWALVVYAGAQLGRVLPLAPGDQILGRVPACEICLPDDEISRQHARLRLLPGPGGGALTLEDLGSTNGTLLNGQLLAGPATLKAGDRIGVGSHVLKVISLDALERAFHETLLDQSTRDALTGLANRSAILGELQRRFELSRRHGRPLAVVMADLDHFKAVNDTRGHGGGDRVLSHFGDVVRQNLRGTDLAGRVGGEEFLLVLPETDREGAQYLAERLRGAVAGSPVDFGEERLQVTCSLGVAERRAEDRDAGDLLGRVDAALYEAKHAGRNRVVMAGPPRPGPGR